MLQWRNPVDRVSSDGCLSSRKGKVVTPIKKSSSRNPSPFFTIFRRCHPFFTPVVPAVPRLIPSGTTYDGSGRKSLCNDGHRLTIDVRRRSWPRKPQSKSTPLGEWLQHGKGQPTHLEVGKVDHVLWDHQSWPGLEGKGGFFSVGVLKREKEGVYNWGIIRRTWVLEGVGNEKPFGWKLSTVALTRLSRPLLHPRPFI